MLKDLISLEELMILIGNDVQGVSALLLVDMDDQKLLDKKLGRKIGFQQIENVCSRIVLLKGGDDALAWKQGDEVYLYTRRSIEEIFHLARAIHDSCQYIVDGVQVSVSIGIGLTPRDGRDAESLLNQAKYNRKCAKALGKNTFIL